MARASIVRSAKSWPGAGRTRTWPPVGARNQHRDVHKPSTVTGGGCDGAVPRIPAALFGTSLNRESAPTRSGELADHYVVMLLDQAEPTWHRCRAAAERLALRHGAVLQVLAGAILRT